MGWRVDKGRFLEWAISALIGVTVALLCYQANVMATEISDNQRNVDAIKARVDHSEGRSEINEHLLQEVRDDVKELLRRTK